MTTLLDPEVAFNTAMERATLAFNTAMERATLEFDKACQMVLAAGWPPERCRIVENVLRIKRTLWVDYRETDGKPDGVPVFEIEVADNSAEVIAKRTTEVSIEIRMIWINRIPEYSPS